MKSKLIKIILIILLFLIFLFNYNIYNKNNFSNKCKQLNIIKFKFSNSPKIVVISGVHGNEPGPILGIEKFINDNFINQKKVKRGNIIFIPRVNFEGIEKNTRNYPCVNNNYDINRHFYDTIQNQPNKKILEIIKNSDFVLDLHEGYDFHLKNKKSVGSTIIYVDFPNNYSKNIAKFIIIDLNNTIKTDFKKFVIMPEKERSVKNTLSYYCNIKNINYNLVEITGQNNKQPIELRNKQAYIIVNSLFKYFKLFN